MYANAELVNRELMKTKNALRALIVEVAQSTDLEFVVHTATRVADTLELSFGVWLAAEYGYKGLEIAHDMRETMRGAVITILENEKRVGRQAKLNARAERLMKLYGDTSVRLYELTCDFYKRHQQALTA